MTGPLAIYQSLLDSSYYVTTDGGTPQLGARRVCKVSTLEGGRTIAFQWNLDRENAKLARTLNILGGMTNAKPVEY